MKKQHFIVLLVVAAIIAIVLFIQQNKEKTELKQLAEKIGNQVIADLNITKIRCIRIFSGKDVKVELSENNNSWIVANLYNYPADPEKIRSFALDLTQMKNMKNIAAGESQLERLGLNGENTDGSQPSLRVELHGKDAKIAEFIAGKKHFKTEQKEFNFQTPNGRFLMFPETKKILVADKPLNQLDNEPFDWIDKNFFSVSKIKKATLIDEQQNIVWALQRETENENMTMLNIPEGKELDSSKVSDVSSVLNYLSFANIADPKTPDETSGMDKAKVFYAEDFDNIKYSFKIGAKENNNYYVKVSAEYLGAEEEIKDDNKDKEDKEKKDDVEENKKSKIKEAKDKVSEINQKYAQWLYLFPEYKIKNMIISLNDFFKKEEKKEEENKEESNKREVEEEKESKNN